MQLLYMIILQNSCQDAGAKHAAICKLFLALLQNTQAPQATVIWIFHFMLVCTGRFSVSILIFRAIFFKTVETATEGGKGNINKKVLRLQRQKMENLTPEMLAKSMWVSTALALVFALPPLALFIGLYDIAGVNIGIAAGVGFGLHFATLAFSKKISAALSRLFD